MEALGDIVQAGPVGEHHSTVDLLGARRKLVRAAAKASGETGLKPSSAMTNTLSVESTFTVVVLCASAVCVVAGWVAADARARSKAALRRPGMRRTSGRSSPRRVSSGSTMVSRFCFFAKAERSALAAAAARALAAA